jgi:poly [ADP-ribose] polymerase
VQPLPGVDEILKIYEAINTLSNQYYELIPHTNYSRAAIPPLDTVADVDKKLTALQSLVDVEVACKILMGAQYRMNDMHPLMYCFTSLEIKAEPIPKSSKEFMYLFKYIENTAFTQVRACTRPLNQLEFPERQKESYSLEVVSILKIQRKGEAERIGKWKSLENHRLLWHGSRSSNFLGILSQGLRIAPPEAPVSGYAFGKGIYFADCFAKSFGYCQGTKHAFLLLSEVALGNMCCTSTADAPHVDHDTVSAPLGFNSVYSPGNKGPDWNKSIVMPNGVSIPVERAGNLQQNSYGYGHSEYIVYDASQVRLRYLVHVRNK